ncbi:2-phospho-L-lactate transferase [Lysinimonas soli]|uniref:2-phospho-L-lactate transferase n=1 Tax=Lysinimonas soli TaxID=1074233 RepID=A0ABW0NTY8_9MICO
MKVVVLAGGVGGSRFLRGVRARLRQELPDGSGGTTAQLTAVVNTGDDLWLAGLRITPDLDTILYTLAGINDTDRGWGRVGDTERVSAELAEWGVGHPWFTLGDLDLAASIARTAWLREGIPLHEVATRLQARWPLGLRLLPATDDEVETHVVVDDPDHPGRRRELHFQEWWTRYRASLAARAFVQDCVDAAAPAPGVLEALADADVVLLAPSNPVVSIGTILGIPGLRDAVRATAAPVVGISPIIGGAVVRGMADACLTAIGVSTDAAAVARHYGRRSDDAVPGGGLLDGWLVDEVDAAGADALTRDGIRTRAVPLWLRDEASSAAVAAAALDLAAELARR